MRRQCSPTGFTLVEVLVAIAIGVIVLAALISALIHTSRGVTREELAMRRSRVTQRIFSRLEDDLARLSPMAAAPDMPGSEAASPVLRSMGYSGDFNQLLTERRHAANVIHAYFVDDAQPYLAHTFPFQERYIITVGPTGQKVLVLDKPGTFYIPEKPPEGAPHSVQIPPTLAAVAALACTEGVATAPKPAAGATEPAPTPAQVLAMICNMAAPADPPSLLGTPTGAPVGPVALPVVPLQPAIVLWGFASESTDKKAVGHVWRWDSLAGNLEDLSRESRVVASVDLRQEWLHVDPKPSVNPVLEAPGKFMAHAKLDFVPDASLPFPDPGFQMERAFTSGL